MRTLATHNPIAAAVYFLCVSAVAMFSMDPIILALSLAGAIACCIMYAPGTWRGHLYTLALFIAMVIINPLVSHKGVTVLFVMNHNPITLEAVLYGLAAASMVVAVLYWFRSFSAIMTSDKLLYIFGALSPKLSLVLSMALRYVPLFGTQARRVRQAQTALGLYKEDNAVDSFRGGLRIFSTMVTWALENGVTTADSMTARGYGVGRRSRFSLFRWTGGDVLLLTATLALTCLSVWGMSRQAVSYYPFFTLSPFTDISRLGYAAYAILAALPLIIHGKEALRWRCLQSRM